MYRDGVSWEEPGIPQESGKHPVVQVSRADAEAFANWLSAKTGQKWRLPSEAEWEYAARAGTDTAYFWGEDINDGNEYAAGYDVRTDEAIGYGFEPIMETDDGAAYTAEVVSYEPNPWGLYDMTGNAREWVQDYWEPNYDSGPDSEATRTGGERPSRSCAAERGTTCRRTCALPTARRTTTTTSTRRCGASGWCASSSRFRGGRASALLRAEECARHPPRRRR